MPKLPQGVNRRKDGLLEKRFTINGRRVSVYAHTVRELQDKETEKRREIKQGIYTRNADITVERYFSEWIKEKSRHIKQNTLNQYETRYKKYIAPVIGSEKLRKIERREIAALTEKAKADSSTITANLVLQEVRAILESAVHDEIITRNPAETIKPYKAEQKPAAAETIHRALTREEQAAFLDAVKDAFLREMLEMLLCTGLRFGECAALTWSDIDNKAEVIKITKTVTVGKGWKRIIAEGTKTKTSRREIPLTNAVKAVLKRQRQKAIDLYGLTGIQPESLVFRGIQGDIVQNTVITHTINMAIKKMNAAGLSVDRFSVHALRDTFATRFIESGGNPQTLKSILGHSSLSMTMDLYSHVLPNTKAEEMERIAII